MSELFDVRELVQIGIEDETSGVVFYTAVSQKCAAAEIRAIFSDLARQEAYHKQRFEQMLESMGGYQAREQYPGEYTAYLQALTQARAFPDRQAAAAKAAAIGSDAEAVDLASQFERDTLVLMGEMKQLVRPQDVPIINELMREEQAHLVKLAEARRALQG